MDVRKQCKHVQLCTSAIILHIHIAGDISVEEMTFELESDPTDENPQFTLSCVSSGGPATTVTWYRDSVDISEEVGMVSVLQNTSAAQYNHTVSVSGRRGGLYQCSVSNDKPSMASSQLNVRGTCPENNNFMTTITCRNHSIGQNHVMASLLYKFSYG